MKIAYLGPACSFSYIAAKKAYDKERLLAYPSIIDCLQAVENAKTDIAVVPIENSTEGTITQTLDYLFQQSKLKILKELVLPIKQQFLIHFQNQGKQIEKILSHPQAIAQSRKFLRESYPETPVWHTSSTANAAEYLKEHPAEKFAAVGSEFLAQMYNLLILHRNIQDLKTNSTRFWVLRAKALHNHATLDKYSLTFTMPNNGPGVLNLALCVFAKRNINLTKIESRPLKTVLGEYFFWIDCANVSSEKLFNDALEELKSLGGRVTFLGSYEVVKL
ncbi:MAG: prephenate dehydratase [Lactobacillales bacterium]|jgi:prephenate dehydratase|nr:prephenate dehydratase [Lactobacillales bacterium]